MRHEAKETSIGVKKLSRWIVENILLLVSLALIFNAGILLGRKTGASQFRDVCTQSFVDVVTGSYKVK